MKTRELILEARKTISHIDTTGAEIFARQHSDCPKEQYELIAGIVSPEEPKPLRKRVKKVPSVEESEVVETISIVTTEAD